LILLNEAGIGIPSAADYARRYRAARAEAARMGTAARRQLVEVYIKAAEEAAAVVSSSLERGLSSLTVERWQVLAVKLMDAADSVARGTESVAKALVGQAAPLFPEVDAEFLYQASRFTGADRKITREGLGRMIAGITKMGMHKQFVGLDYASGLLDFQGGEAGAMGDAAGQGALGGKGGAAK
jgi:hypothetical protein